MRRKDQDGLVGIVLQPFGGPRGRSEGQQQERGIRTVVFIRSSALGLSASGFSVKTWALIKSSGSQKLLDMRINAIRFALGCVLAATLAGRAAETPNPLWQIGRADHRGAEFALAPTNYRVLPASVRQSGPRLLYRAFQAGERLALHPARTAGRLGRQQRQRALGPDEHTVGRIHAGASRRPRRVRPHH